jgi:hypothetical protein
MKDFEKEIQEAIAELTKYNPDTEYIIFRRENGFAIITKKGWDKLSKAKKNLLFPQQKRQPKLVIPDKEPEDVAQ